ncbi:hypothetical protein Tco_0648932 [Tanacetum coccineum]
MCDDQMYSDGEVGNKRITRLISRLKRLHLSSDERKCVLREAISTDHGLYMALEETLKVFDQWLCGKCMTLHAVSRACHHPDGLVRLFKEPDDMSGYIVGIFKHSNKESDIEATEGLALDAELLDRVFKLPITTAKSIRHGCRLAFSQALKTVLYKVVAQPDSIVAWVRWALTAAVKVLSSSGVASYCDDTIKTLEAKHPYRTPPSMPSNTFSEPPLVAEIDCVFGCIKSFPKGTSCGRDGLRAQHIFDALYGEGSATAIDILKSIVLVVNLWLAGRCPPILAEFVASAPLRPLLKPDNKIRPIAVGTFGVGVSGGTEAILHSANRVLSKYHNDGSLAMLTVDFSNAFNLVDRPTLLHEYLDDGTVIGDSKQVSRVLDIIKVSGPGLGLELNIKKTEIFWPSCNGMKLREGLFPVDIRRSSLGVKLLGGAVSRDIDFISGLAMRRAANAVELMTLLSQTCQPVHMKEWRLASLPILLGGLGLYSAKVVSSYAFVASRAQSWVLQDHILHDSGICGMDDDYVSALACLRDTIPSFDFSKTVFECLRAPHAQDFLLAIPIDGFGQHMSPVEYRTILKYRLIILLFPVDAICPICRKACLDSFGKYAVHCKELSGFKYRHDMIRDVLFDICRRAGISAKKEAPVNFLTDPSDVRSTLRPADVLVFGWVVGKHACVDVGNFELLLSVLLYYCWFKIDTATED